MNNRPYETTILILVVAVLLTAGSYGEYFYWELKKANYTLMEKNFQLQSLMGILGAQLNDVKYENKQLTETLRAEQDKNSLFEREIMNISGTVSTLQKLTATDPQLLQKYSKIYFLNENYIP